MQHLLVIPVHQLCTRSLAELAQEAAACGPEAAVLLLDSSAHADEHRQLLEPGMLHLTREGIGHFCAAFDPALRRLLAPGPVANYGKVANLAALAAISLGATTLTRRDNDEYLVTRPAWPRDLELLRDHPELWVAGTIHYGDCESNIDLIYATGGPKLMAELGHLLGLELDFADPAVRAVLHPPKPQTFEDSHTIAVGAPVYPGLATVRELFRHFCVSPADETPDVDNLYLAVATAAGWPVASHTRVLEHRHPSDRTSMNPTYWRRLALAIDYNSLMNPILKTLSGRPNEVAQALQQGLAERLERPDHADRCRRLEAYRHFLAQLKDTRALAQQLDPPTIVKAQDAAAADHLRLLRQWHQLVQTAAATPLPI